MKVMIINNVYANGSTGKIVEDIYNGLQERGIETVVLYGRGDKSNSKSIRRMCSDFYSHVNKVLSMMSGLMYGGCFLSTRKIINIIKKEKPDIINLHCINGYFVNIYKLISWINKQGIPTVLTLHAEFMHTGNCGYSLECEKWKTGCGKCPRLKQETKSIIFDRTHQSWIKMLNAFEGFEKIVAVSVSPWLMERAMNSPILSKIKHLVIRNGLNTDVFHLKDGLEMRKKMDLVGKKVVFHATPDLNDNPSHIKGGHYLFKLARMMEDVVFVVAGPFSRDVPKLKNVILLGNVNDQNELSLLYSMSDLTVLVSKKETFSMVVAESLCCGTPVVGFFAGAPETIAISDYSAFVSYGDVESLRDKCNSFLNTAFDKKSISNKALEEYSNKKMVENYIEIYNQLL